MSGIYRKKVERLTEALNNPEDRSEAADAIRALIEKITPRPGPNRGEIDATLHCELVTILGWIEAQAIGKTQKRETPAAFATPEGATTHICAFGAIGTLRRELVRLQKTQNPSDLE